jgi:hypothetical protein
MVSMQPCDLTKPADCQVLVDFAVRSFGRIDVLFNNDAMAYFNWLEDISDEKWDRNRRSEVDLVREPWLSGTHDGQGWHHRYDPAAGDGRPRAWDSR